MKFKLITAFLLLQSITLLGQDEAKHYLLETDSTWAIEIFHFPLGFAPTIQYRGTEDVRFPPGWRKEESPEFWSYVFVWNIDVDTTFTTHELEANFQLYFDGLMNAVNKDTTLVPPPTTALFLQKERSDQGATFVGKIRIFDAFVTQKQLTLNATAQQYYCEKQKKSVTIFRFSPQPLNHEVWKTLEQAQLRPDACDRE